jgi:2-methylcitrate dehydratase PrpD
LEEDEAYAKLTMNDGTEHEVSIEHATGSIHNPMTDEALIRKFKKVVAPIIPNSYADALINRLYRLEEQKSVKELLQYCKG